MKKQEKSTTTYTVTLKLKQLKISASSVTSIVSSVVEHHHNASQPPDVCPTGIVHNGLT